MLCIPLLGLGIGWSLAGLVLVAATSIYRRRTRNPEVVLALGGVAVLSGLVMIAAALFSP